LYGSQSRTARRTDERILIPVEMHLMRTAGHVLSDRKRNEIVTELQISQITEFIE